MPRGHHFLFLKLEKDSAECVGAPLGILSPPGQLLITCYFKSLPTLPSDLVAVPQPLSLCYRTGDVSAAAATQNLLRLLHVARTRSETSAALDI